MLCSTHTFSRETGHVSLVITQNGEVCKVDVSSVLETKMTRQSNLNDEVESNAGEVAEWKDSLSNDQELSATSLVNSAKTIPRAHVRDVEAVRKSQGIGAVSKIRTRFRKRFNWRSFPHRRYDSNFSPHRQGFDGLRTGERRTCRNLWISCRLLFCSVPNRRTSLMSVCTISACLCRSASA